MTVIMPRNFGYGTRGGCVLGPRGGSGVKRETSYKPPEIDIQKSCEECDVTIDNVLDTCINEECSEFLY